MRLLQCLCAAVLVSVLFVPSAPAQERPRDGVFIHISHGKEDPHRLLMGLTMATRMMDDKDVLIYMDIEAVRVLLKGAPPVTQKVFEPSDVLLKKLLEAKVTVMACPTCLKVAGKEPADLLPGIQVARKEAFFSFTAGRILSLDY
jgi:predicted peroxiredoxin